MLFTKLGILSLFVAAKPSVNMQSVSENPAYKCFDFDYYYKRFNWLFDGAYNKLYIIYEKDFDKLGCQNAFC